MIRPETILVFRQSSLGDVILTLPVLQRLREKFPQSEIDYLTKSACAPVIETDPAIRHLHRFDDSGAFADAIKGLSKIRYDLFIDLQSNFRSYIIQFSIFPKRTLRYRKRRWAREMIVRRPHLKLSAEHTIIAYLRALTDLGISPDLIPPCYHLPDNARQFAQGYLLSSGITTEKKLVAVCPGARHPEKKWPLQKYRETALSLLDNESLAVVVFTLTSDNIPPDLEIKHPRLIVAHDLDIPRSAALLACCRLALTNDSGLMHLANAVGARTIAIFGPTNPRLGFSPSLPGSMVVCDDVACSPCSVHGQKKCYQPRKYCFEKITPQRVTAEMMKLL